MKKRDTNKLIAQRGSLDGKYRGAAVATLVLAIVLVLIASYAIMQLMESRAHASAEKLVSTVVQHVDEKTKGVELVTRDAAEIANKELYEPDKLEQLVRTFVEENDFVYGSTIAFEPNVFPEKGRCFAPYSWATPDGEIHSRQLGTETDYYAEEWYAETKKSGKEYWCEPYFDEGGAKIMMCTFTIPLKDDSGKMVAAMTADVGLDDLDEYVSTINPIADSSIILRSIKGVTLADSGQGDGTGNSEVIIKGIADIGWSVELMVPFAYLMHGDTGIFVFAGIIFLFIILLVYFINRFLIRMQQRSSAEYINVIDAISSSFSSIFLVNLINNELISLRNPEEFEKIDNAFKNDLNFTRQLDELIKYNCYEQDEAQMREETALETIRQKLENQDRYELRFRKVTEQGKISWHEMHVFILERDEDGAPIRAVIAYTDVNKTVREELEAQEKLEKALADAQVANRAKTTFLFNMSHDIRTPMNAILGYTDMTLRHLDDTEIARDSLQKIKSAGGHLLNLINDILEMSRIEAGKLELFDQPLDIREAISGVENMSKALAIPKSIDFKVKVGEIKNPYIKADELHLNEVFINIISNAMKYSKEDGTVTYAVDQISEAADGKAWYRVQVIDDGIGMSEEFLEHIYESFAREKTSTVSKLEGAGLGLSIVKRIVDLAEGRIDIKSKLGVGTTVTVELPLQVMNDDEIEAFKKAHEEGEGNLDKSSVEGRKVLVVEDNELNLEIAVDILQDEGMNVETAVDGSIAVDVMREKGPDYFDLILMDIQMPVMDGYEATKEIREMYSDAGIPIIAVSANAFEEDKQKSLEAGMNEHIAKPIDIQELISVMAKYI